MRAMGRDDLADEPGLAQNDGRVLHAQRLDEAIAAWTETKPLEEALAILEAADVPAARIYTAADIHADEHVRARAMIERHPLPDGTPIDLLGAVPKLGDTPGATKWVGPELGAHTAEVLAAIGIDASELQRLRREGVIG